MSFRHLKICKHARPFCQQDMPLANEIAGPPTVNSVRKKYQEKDVTVGQVFLLSLTNSAFVFMLGPGFDFFAVQGLFSIFQLVSRPQ